jgi:predicted Zn-dependent protease
MKKLAIHILLWVGLMSGSFLVLRSLPWTDWFHIPRWTKETEKKWGDLCLEFFTIDHAFIREPAIHQPIDSILQKICIANGIDPKTIQWHILEHDEVNAFALPDRHLVIYSSLITHCEDPRALAGVLSHEIAHLEENHVSKKLIKELGITVLIGLSGSQASMVIKEVAKTISSTAYDRELEKEADIKAVDYLKKATVDPIPFAKFLESLDEGEKIDLSWMQTHPDSKARGQYIRKQAGNTASLRNRLVDSIVWTQAQDALLQREFAPLDTLNISR